MHILILLTGTQVGKTIFHTPIVPLLSGHNIKRNKYVLFSMYANNFQTNEWMELILVPNKIELNIERMELILVPNKIELNIERMELIWYQTT